MSQFSYTGSIGGFVASGGFSIYAGPILGFNWNNEFRNRQIIADYSGPFEGFYVGAGVLNIPIPPRPGIGISVGVGFFHDPSWKVRGQFNFYSAGYGLLPVEIVSFGTSYRYIPGSVEYYADKKGNVDKGKLLHDILVGDRSPIALGIIPTTGLPGISSQRASQIGTISIAAIKYEFYWKLRHWWELPF